MKEVKFSLNRQLPFLVQEPDDEFKSDGTKKDASGLGSFQFGKKSDSEKKALKRLNTHMYVGTEVRSFYLFC